MIIMLGIILTAMGSAFGSTALWIGAGLMSLAVLFSIVLYLLNLTQVQEQ